mgnify:CR=1 FL=1
MLDGQLEAVAMEQELKTISVRLESRKWVAFKVAASQKGLGMSEYLRRYIDKEVSHVRNDKWKKI